MTLGTVLIQRYVDTSTGMLMFKLGVMFRV